MFFRKDLQSQLMKRLLVFLVILIFLPLVCQSQSSVHRFGLEGQYGWILAHNPELEEVAQSNPVSIGFSAQWMRTSRKNWEACNCFHYLGLSLSVVDFQNPEELGQALNLAGSFEPFIFRSGRLAGSISTGMGISYITKIYDPIENPRNTFFSAPISFLLFVTPKITYELSSNWAIQGSLSYSHISNGGQRQPNRGMNFPMFGLGVLHYTRKADFPDYEKNPISKQWFYYAEVSFNTRESENGGRQPNFSLTGAAFRQLAGIIGLGGGLEMAKDFSLPVESNLSEALIPGVFVENHFLFGKFDFSQRMVKYLSKPKGYQEDHAFYQRYLISYSAGKSLRLGAGLKTHGHVAEFLDFRIGWNF